MPPALRFRLIESDAPPPPAQPSLDEVPVLPPGPPRNSGQLHDVPEVGVSAIEVHDPIGGAARDGSIFRRLFVLSLVIHAIIVFATMWTSPFGDERSAGGSDEIIPLDGISVEIVDSLPGDGAAIPAPLSLGTLLDADDTSPAPVKVASAADTRPAAEPDTTLVTEEGLTAAAEALAPPAQPVAVQTASALGEMPGNPAPDAEAQLEIDTPSFAVAASAVASAPSLTIESVIAASEMDAAAKVEPPAAAAVLAPAESAATAGPAEAASAQAPEDAETIASSLAVAASPAPTLAGTARDDVPPAREATPSDAAAAIGGSAEAESIADNVAAAPGSANAIAAVEAPAVPAAATPSDTGEVASPDPVEAAPSRLASFDESLPSAAGAAATDRQALDSPRAVPAQTASASAPQAAVAAAERADEVTNRPAIGETASAVAAPPVFDTTLSASPRVAANRPVEQAIAATAAAPGAAIEPVAGDPNFDAVAAQPGADTGTMAEVAPVDAAEDAPPAAPVAVAESSEPASTATAAPTAADTTPEASTQTNPPPTPDADRSLQSDPLNLVDAPLPRPRPNTDVAGLDTNTAVPETTAPPKPKAVTKPAPRPAKPAASSAPLLGGILSPFSAAQTDARGPTAGIAGAGGSNRDAQGRASASSYQATLFAHLRRFRSYPPEARQQGIGGTATVTFTVNATGALVSVTLSGRSGAAILDREAVAMVRRASPFPPIPAGLHQSQMTVRAPIRFDIR